eukprot:SAG25_NODE_7833_length_455_cov_1.297753_1_plen_88_part_10
MSSSRDDGALDGRALRKLSTAACPPPTATEEGGRAGPLPDELPLMAVCGRGACPCPPPTAAPRDDDGGVPRTNALLYSSVTTLSLASN